MNEIYLVWEIIPEATSVYHLVQLSDKDFERIKGCHGHFMNDEVDTPDKILDDLSWLNEYLVGKESSLLYSNETHSTSPIEIKDGILVICGWVL